MILPWTAITDSATLDYVIATLHGTKRRETELSTAIGAAIVLGLFLLEPQSQCWKRTIDLSGDDRSNMGLFPETVPVPAGITVNGLVIGEMPRSADRPFMDIMELSAYYRANVIRGPDAFVETALGFDDFEAAMTRKLIRELQPAPIGFGPAIADPFRVAALRQ